MRAVIQRLALTIGVLVVALALNFLIPRLMPGSPLKSIGGEDVGLLSVQEKEALAEAYGLNKPMHEQLSDYVVGLTQGDLGISLRDARPVVDHIDDRLGRTLLLVGSALVISTILGVGSAAWLTTSPKRRHDTLGMVGALALESLPGFWVAMLMIYLFGVTLGWLPTFGAKSLIGGGGLIDRARHMVLPVATLVIGNVGQTYLVTRSALLATLGSTHMAHGKARGVPRHRLRFRHALRASALPIHTLVMMEVAWLVGGSVIVETVFAYPGLGRLVFDAIQGRDYPVLQGAFLLLTFAVVGANALADITYPLVDPRARGNHAQL